MSQATTRFHRAFAANPVHPLQSHEVLPNHHALLSTITEAGEVLHTLVQIRAAASSRNRGVARLIWNRRLRKLLQPGWNERPHRTVPQRAIRVRAPLLRCIAAIAKNNWSAIDTPKHFPDPAQSHGELRRLPARDHFAFQRSLIANEPQNRLGPVRSRA